MRISFIAAVDERGVIGRDNALPWRLPEDLRRFRRITMGKPLVMGRRTHESIGRVLPGRHNIVLTRDPGYRAPGCTVAHDLASALVAAGDTAEVMVIGGADMYRLFLPRASRIYLTEVHAASEGDTFFPDFDRAQWREVSREERCAGAGGRPPYSFVVLERRAADAG